MNNQDTTAVLPPISGQVDEQETSHQPGSAPNAQGTKSAASSTEKPSTPEKQAGERRRSGKLGEDKRFKIFSGTSNKVLAEEICKFVGVPLGETRLQRFSDGEVHFQLLENVRGADVFLVQPTCFP